MKYGASSCVGSIDDVHGIPCSDSACSTVHGAFFFPFDEDKNGIGSTKPIFVGRINVVADDDVGLFTHPHDGCCRSDANSRNDFVNATIVLMLIAVRSCRSLLLVFELESFCVSWMDQEIFLRLSLIDVCDGGHSYGTFEPLLRLACCSRAFFALCSVMLPQYFGLPPAFLHAIRHPSLPNASSAHNRLKDDSQPPTTQRRSCTIESMSHW